ncbi:MAG: hypothetical protein PHX60_03560, partial [Giesbergeria sp.]|nr:hypothetical protein [Giesbergeria sp.]
MSQTIFGAPGVVSILNRAFTNTSPGNLAFQSQIAAAGTTRESQVLFAAEFGNGFASLVNDSEVLTDTIITNMGLSGVEAEFLAALRAEVIALFESVPPSVRGVVVLLLSEVLSSVEGATGDLALMSPVAAAWNTEVAKSFQYSNDTNNTNPGDPLEEPVDTAAPVVAADQAFEYAENQEAGAVVATVAATDDVAVTAFEIVSGNDEGYFAIDAEGKI